MVSKLGYAGKPDTWAAPMLYDIKTGSFPISTGLQLAAYEMLIQENFPGTPKLSRRGVQLSKEGKYTIRTGVNVPRLNEFVSFDDPRWMTWWISCLNVYRSGLMKIEEVES